MPIAANAFETPRLSPDGRTLAVTIRDVLTDVWAYDLATGAATRITSGANRNDTPVWRPDGRTIAFAGAGGVAPRPVVLSTRVDDAGRQPAVLREARPTDRPGLVQLNSSSPDGHVLAGTQAGDLWLLDTSAANPRLVVIDTPFTEGNPAVSPDGRWIAYTSDRTSQTEVYVQDFPGLRELRRVSTHGGTEPVWSRDGHELFYRESQPMSATRQMMAVPVATLGAFVAGSPRPLFRETYMTDAQGGTSYDVAPDGQHFLMIRADPPSTGNDLRVVRRWFALLDR